MILGEILAQQIERRLGVKVERKLNLGGTLLAHQALTSGSIDLYPEYTGTALTAILKLETSNDASAVLDRVRTEYRNRWRIEWLDPLGFNNTFAMVVRPADTPGITTLSEAAARKKPWKMGVGYEFITRPDGLAGLQKTYNLPLAGAPISMDLGLLYKALSQGQVDIVAGNRTDGLIASMGLKVLEDGRRYFPPYQAAVAVRQEALATHQGLREALAELSGRFTDDTMQRLNNQVDGEHRAIREVARAFLDGAATR
ncbi:MAG: glycine betaine ABC transporter substrate-binding protein [Bryobacteraceae bacterium]